MKPVLTPTSKLRQPVNNTSLKLAKPNNIAIFIENLYRAITYVQRQLFWGPKGGKFDCSCKTQIYNIQLKVVIAQ